MNYQRGANENDEPIVSFNNADNAWHSHVITERDDTYDVSYRPDGDLERFLSRPVKIASYEWNVGGSLDESFDPWSLFLQNANVKRRLENYWLLRGDLEISILINGNSFFYGRAIASYEPLPDFRPFEATTIEMELALMQASQRPHVFLDPCTSTGGTLCVPYFWPKNWINLPFADYKKLGRVDLISFGLLRQANDALGVVRISVFAKMNNVKLTIPTVNPVDSISPESSSKPVSKRGSQDSKKADEYGDGIISMPASILAKAAGAITKAPIIGKYAMASQIALEGVANIARLFGYSRPPIVANIQPARQITSGFMAYTNLDEEVAKLSLDAKQELSIDPSTVGLSGVDQMTLSHVLQKESYLTSFEWSRADDEEDRLFQINVSPLLFSTFGVWPGTGGKAVLTPLCHASQMFTHWRGSIVFRFQLVASAFHKGRIRVTYDPYSTGLFTSSEYNIAYNDVIDLAERKDFEITVRWAQDTGWKRVAHVRNYVQDQVHNASTLFPIADRTNGMLQVSVVNELTVPNVLVNAPVRVNVFARAGDDFELANPSEGGLTNMTYNPYITPEGDMVEGDPKEDEIEPESASNEETATGMSSDLDNAPTQVEEVPSIGGTPILPTDNTLYVNMGEKVASLRQLMKRYVWHDIIKIANTSSGTWIMEENKILNFPALYGSVPEARLPVTGYKCNRTHTTYLNWVVPCYAGYRGGIRRKAQYVGISDRVSCMVNRNESSITGDEQTKNKIDLSSLTGSETQEANYQFPSGRGGAFSSDAIIAPTLEYELPFYSEYRFAHSQTLDNSKVLTRTPNGFNHDLMVISQGLGTDPGFYRTAVAAAEDFSCFWYLNTPVTYCYDLPAA